MNRNISLKRLIFSFFLLVALSACGSPPSDTGAGNPDSGRSVILNLRMAHENTDKLKSLNAVSSPIALIEVEVTGDGTVLASVKVHAIPEELVTIKLDILPGLNRKFSIIIRDEEGEIVLEGQTTVDIEASGSDVPLSITIELKSVRAPVISPPSPITLSALNSAGLPATNPEIQAFLSAATALDASGKAIVEITNDAPATFPLGETTVTFSATDTAGNPGSAISTVTIMDEDIPIVTPPTPIIVSAVDASGTPAVADAIQTFLNGATALDNVDGVIALVTHNAPVIFPLGETTITFSATDVAGNTGSAISTVTVSDVLAPVVTTPAPMNVGAVNAAGISSSAAVIQAFLNGATALDNVDGVIALVTHNAPAVFPLGSTTVIFSATDAAGNIGSNTSTVTVIDQAPPVVTAPTPVIVAALDASGTPSTNADIQAFLSGATAIDNVDGVIANITDNAPNTFPLGETIITFSATDAAGEIGIATSIVTIRDEAIPVVTAPAAIIVDAVDGFGTPASNVVIQAFLAGATALDNVDGVIVLITHDAQAVLPIGSTIVRFSATDAAGNTGSATSTVTVKDVGAPVVTAPTAISVDAVDGSGTPASNLAIQAFLNGATAIDIVDGVMAIITNNAPATFPLGVTTVTFSATDSSDNTTIAQSTVTIQDQKVPVVTAPASIDVAAVNAAGTVATAAVIQAFLNGGTALDNVDGVIALVSHNAPAVFPIGLTTVIFSATDAAGNTGSATSTVTIGDVLAPVVTAPAPIINVAAVNAAGTPATAAVIQTFLNGGTALDNVDGVIPLVTHNAPAVFPLGSTTVIFSATDAAGNTGSAISTVTVGDVLAPVVTTPAPIINVAAVNAAGTPATAAVIQTFLNGGTALDNVDGIIALVTHNAPAVFPLGLTTVIFSATDTAGNTGSATSTVTVGDVLAPVVTAPAPINNVAAVNAAGTPSTAAVIQAFLNGATAIDNVDGVIVLVTHNAPAVFPLGLTTVTFSATDAAGNTGSAISTVTVGDVLAPVVTTPAPINVAAVNAAGTAATAAAIQAFLNGATALDNVDGVIALITNNSRATFPLGVTTITFSATDAAGNTGRTTSTVTVGDQGIPVITLLGGTPVDVAIGTPYVDAGATAFDGIDGDITVNIVTVNLVNTSIPGNYVVTYNVSDAAGNAALQVSRTVRALPFLTVTPGGSGTGTVTSSPTGINCGEDCTEPYVVNTIITLTATPAAGSVFAGFGGDVDCIDGSVTMTASRNCTVTFNLQTFTLTVTPAGTATGTGTVISSPLGINCGVDCSESYNSGTVVTLTATPDAGSFFAGFGGDADCFDGSVTMTSGRNCMATFSAGALPVTFDIASKSAVGLLPISIAMGDFNGDGNLDSAVVNNRGDSVSILLGDGTGGFGLATNFVAGVNPKFVAIGDLNGDGKLDLAVTNFRDNNVSILLGNGAGGFGFATNFAVGFSPSPLVMGDLNGDGKLDIVVGNTSGNNNISILLGDGEGSFGLATNFAIGEFPSSVAIGDLNRDGKLDIAVGNTSDNNNISILLGDGEGSFGIVTNFTAGVLAVAVAIGDLNGDGTLDLVVANRTSKNISILLGDGEGSFGLSTNLALEFTPEKIVMGDFNGDGKLDLATQSLFGTSSVSILLGDGEGSFGIATNFAAGGDLLSALAIGDLNRDGKLDLAVGSFGNDVSVLLNSTSFPSSGSFATATNIAAGTEIFSIATEDFNGDGKPDIAVTNLGSNNVSIYLGDGAGAFALKSGFSVGIQPVSIAVGDFNRDGKLDLAVANGTSNNVSVLLGIGSGSFSPATHFTVGFGPENIKTGDFNRDGKLDLATANSGNDAVSILLGNGAGSFASATNFPVGLDPLSVTFADINGDGKLDFATANVASNSVSVRLGNGSGSFGAASPFPVGTSPASVAVRDVNGDGKLDLVTANFNSNTVSIRLGNGTGSFGAASQFAVGANPISVAVGDLNRDGKLDLATANFGSDTVSVLFGNGAGSFGNPSHFGVGLDPTSIVMKDFNGDGRLDLATANRLGRNISILLNQAGGF